MKKRIVSILLCVVLVFALGSFAFAADIAITAQPQSVTAQEMTPLRSPSPRPVPA